MNNKKISSSRTSMKSVCLDWLGFKRTTKRCRKDVVSLRRKWCKSWIHIKTFLESVICLFFYTFTFFFFLFFCSVFVLPAQGTVCARWESMGPSVTSATQGSSTSAAPAVGPVSAIITPTTAIHSPVSHTDIFTAHFDNHHKSGPFVHQTVIC